MRTVDLTMSRKIPTGERPERYPRSDYKKYTQSKLWDNMGPNARKKSEKETSKESEKSPRINSKCYCGCTIIAVLDEFPIICNACGTHHNAKEIENEKDTYTDDNSFVSVCIDNS